MSKNLPITDVINRIANNAPSSQLLQLCWDMTLTYSQVMMRLNNQSLPPAIPHRPPILKVKKIKSRERTSHVQQGLLQCKSSHGAHSSKEVMTHCKKFLY